MGGPFGSRRRARRRRLNAAPSLGIRPHGWITVVLALGTLLSHGFGIALVPAMLPRIADDLGTGYGTLGAVVAIGLAGYAVGALVSARLLEAAPTVPLLVATYVATGSGLAVAAIATAPALLAVATIVMGFAAPVSWGATVHVAAATVPVGRRAVVMSVASSGAALGVLANGVLVRTSGTLHSWRVSFVIAAGIAVVVALLGSLRLGDGVPRPGRSSGRGGFRAVWRRREGRIAVVAAIFAGTAGFPFSTFVTATALDEMGVSALGAALIWWLIGSLGIVASFALGTFGDRTSPLAALIATATAYMVGVGVLSVRWDYAGLLAAATGFAALNYPIWGLVGALVNRSVGAAIALRAVSLGLVGGALGGAVANAVAGAAIEASGSFRSVVVAIVVVQAGLVAWYLRMTRVADPAEPEAAPA